MRLAREAAEALRELPAVVMRMWQGRAWRSSEAARPLTSLSQGGVKGGRGGG